MWRLTLFKRKRQGFALVFVILIALAMIIPAMMIASSTAPRRKAVTGEAVSDRVLTVADGTVDKILNEINTFPFTFTTPTIIDKSGDLNEATKEAQDYLISCYLSQLNGGVPDITNPINSCNIISNNVSTYLYNLKTQEYYAVWVTPSADFPKGHIAHVSKVGPDGDVETKVIKKLNDTADTGTTTLSAIDPNRKTDNLWVEIDTNVRYGEDEDGNPAPDTWLIRSTAYLLSKPNIKRTIEATANRGEIGTSASTSTTSTSVEKANGNWYTRSETNQDKTIYYSDFSGLYHTTVYFGRYETTRGPIRSDGDLYMGGWAQDPVFATGTVSGEAIDDYDGNNDGRFGPDKKNLTWAKNNGYATDGYHQATWPNGDTALINLENKALSSPSYYVSGDANIVFSVVTDADGNKVGKVKINGGTAHDVSKIPNGAIFVNGDATVSGTVKGRCSVGASGNIYIGGNILYSTPPRINKNTIIPPGYTPDALGLIANNDILIPKSTFNDCSFDGHHHLEIDAAMLAVNGSFGLTSDLISDVDYWHPSDPSGEYEAWWNGCQAVWSTDNAPLQGPDADGYVAGYDIQHTNYDWNLYDFGPPPFYPATNSRTEAEHNVRYKIVTNADTLDFLRSLTKDQLTQISPGDSDYDPRYPYKYTDNNNDTTYYFDGNFHEETTTTTTATATAHMNPNKFYRISWKEQIAKPVKPEP